MALYRYFSGAPFYRQESLQSLLGLSITASTIFDQCEYLVNDLGPVFNVLKQLSGNACHLYVDDTTNRILDQTSVMKKKRHSEKMQKRTGTYTSGLIATTDEDHSIALFQTNIGHAGEWLDEVLIHREAERPPPILMSDALSCNQPTVLTPVKTLCNAHGRRQFVDVMNAFPNEVEQVLNWYQVIWDNDTYCEEEDLSSQQRLDYHQEHSLPIMMKIRDWSTAKLTDESIEENSGLGKAIRYFDNHFEGLTGFCHHKGAKLDNNKMEAQLKLIIRGRKNSMFHNTLAGALVADVLCSVIATAAYAGVNVFDYLNAVQRHSDLVKLNPQQWLPWNYQLSHQ